MTIQQFAEAHRLRTKRDECKETIIPGKQGQIYEYSDEELGVMFMPRPTAEEPWGKWKPKTWGNFRRAAVAMGMVLRQNGDSEGCLSFDPANPEQVALAMKIARVSRKRVLSDSHKAALLSHRPILQSAVTC